VKVLIFEAEAKANSSGASCTSLATSLAGPAGSAKQ